MSKLPGTVPLRLNGSTPHTQDGLKVAVVANHGLHFVVLVVYLDFYGSDLF